MVESHWFYKKKGKKWLLLFLAVFVNLAVILGILLALEPLWGDINYFLGDLFGAESNYVLVLIFLIVLPMLYCGILVLNNLRNLIRMDQIKPNLAHRIASIGLLVFFDLILSVLIIVFGEDAVIVSSVFENINIFLYLLLYIGLFITLYPMLFQQLPGPASPHNPSLSLHFPLRPAIPRVCAYIHSSLPRLRQPWRL